MTRHHERMQSALESAIREVLARGTFHDPRIAGLITVTRVQLTPDEDRAFVHVSVLPAEKERLTLHGLADAAARIRRDVGELIRSRSLPTLEFRTDRSAKKELEILDALQRDRERTEAARPTRPDSEGHAP